MTRWSPRAIIVLILAAAISLAVVLAIGAMAWRGMRLTEAGGEVLVVVLGAVIAIIAAYVGRNADVHETKPLPQEKQTTETDNANANRDRSEPPQ